MRKILFATDLSPLAQGALPHAVRFAGACGGELHLLTVSVLHGPTSPLVEELAGDEALQRALEEVDIDHEPVVRAVTRAVAAAPAILEYADEHDIDLIVMGSHGRRGFRRLLLGSVTEEVIRTGRWPVLTVHPVEGKVPPPSYGKILVPVDFSRASEAAIAMAADLARMFGSTLEFVHIVDIPILPELYAPVSAPVVDVKKSTDRAAERLEELAAPLRTDLSVQTDVQVGGAVHEILESARDGADLIVMPTHGYRGFDRILMGSVAEGVLRRAPCPVLTIKVES